MARKRRSFSPSFKAKVALEAIRGVKTIAQKHKLKEYTTGTDLYKGLRRYFDFYTRERKHSSLDRQTPAEVYRSSRSKRVALSI